MRTVYQLNPKELAEIEKAIRQDKRAEVKQRATVIRLLHLGQKPEMVAEQHLVSVPTVYNWHKLCCVKLEEVLSKEPSADGYRFAIWTSDRLRAHLEKETGIALSEGRFRALLKRKGYRYRRPKYASGSGSSATCLLDEARSTKDCSSITTRHKTPSPYF